MNRQHPSLPDEEFFFFPRISRILRVISQQNGATTVAELAVRLEMADSEVGSDIDRLRAAGVLDYDGERYLVDLEPILAIAGLGTRAVGELKSVG